MTPYLVTLGDSVHWGQGLRLEHKLHWLVDAELRKTHPGLVHHFLAHSRAISMCARLELIRKSSRPSAIAAPPSGRWMPSPN